MTLRHALFMSALTMSVVTTTSAAQNISPSPRLVVFSAFARGPNPPPQTVRFAAASTSAASWRVVGTQRPWLTVTPRDGTAPDSTRFSASSAGMPPGSYTDTVRVRSSTSSDLLLIPVVLVITDPSAGSGQGGGARVVSYDIELSYTGYTGLVEVPNCVGNEQGYDRLVGTVSGFETTASDEDVVYVGTLRRDTDIDFCETKGKDGPGDDERVMCFGTLVGYAVTKVELTVYSHEGAGAFVKTAPAAGPMLRSVSGRCDQEQKDEIFLAYPTASDGGGGSPSGQPIDDGAGIDPGGRSISFVAGGVPRLRVGTFTPVGPQGGWTLRVIRRVP